MLAAAYIAVECVFRNSASAAAVPDEQISNLSGTVTTSPFPSLPFRTQVIAVWQVWASLPFVDVSRARC